jgi:hypothetical protein
LPKVTRRVVVPVTGLTSSVANAHPGRYRAPRQSKPLLHRDRDAEPTAPES